MNHAETTPVVESTVNPQPATEVVAVAAPVSAPVAATTTTKPRSRKAPAAKPVVVEPVVPASTVVAVEENAPAPVVEKKAAVSKAKGKAAVKDSPAAKPVAAKPAKKTAKKAKAVEVRIEPVVKVKRDKVVRDSFSMPKSEQAALKALRVALAKEGRIVSKSELLRAGLALLLQQVAADQLNVLDALPVVPKGKGKKDSE